MYDTSQWHTKNCTNIDVQVTQARKALAEAVGAVKSNTEIAYAYFASKRDEMESELNADAITTGNLQAAELNSTELKQSLTNLVEMITSSGNLDAVQNLIIATRRSADVHKCLITEKESVGKRWDKHYNCTIMTPKYLTLLLEGILSLQEVSAELSKRNGEGSGQRRFDTE
jgi:D-ribose pyranose/furanose isomerase RbsD